MPSVVAPGGRAADATRIRNQYLIATNMMVITTMQSGVRMHLG